MSANSVYSLIVTVSPRGSALVRGSFSLSTIIGQENAEDLLCAKIVKQGVQHFAPSAPLRLGICGGGEEPEYAATTNVDTFSSVKKLGT